MKTRIFGIYNIPLKLRDVTLTYEEHPIAILDRDERKGKRSMVKFVKVQWSNHSEDEATWEREDRLHQEYPDFFSDK